MACGSNCCGTADFFGDRVARRNLRKYRRGGPFGATKRLLEALHKAPGPKETLLDVGGGVGVIAHELLARGASRAALVDASPAFLAAAREESERRNTDDRLDLRLGDAVELSDDVPAADVVTLDKVVCCYVDMEALLGVTASRARRLMGLVYPRDDWWVRAAVAVGNRMLEWRGSEFRSYIHPNAAIEDALRRGGLVPRTRQRGAYWVIAVFERAEAATTS
ncbi:MAG TPA: class I SAM-dependent methyltransferase [Gemmatimonadaceae bacterium]|nr:class I SAM-dependent methyltransferase [Gemmatimonadaceae bacterium]